MLNKNLVKAKKAKNDEFYTQFSDIEREVDHYKSQLSGKIVLCNCDDPSRSNFWKYFKTNFHDIGLKKLISTHYKLGESTYKLEYNGKETTKIDLVGDGDFRSDEVVKVLEESDVVITNPPFSLFREYVAQLIEFEKEFLIIGNFNAVTYKEIFPLLKENKLWIGYSPRSMKFALPNGKLKVVNASWFTNLDVTHRHEEQILYKSYNEEDYPKYDNYDAINVAKVAEIPKDYFGVMGVPITFMTKHNPEQFEILGSQRWCKSQEVLDVYTGNVVPPENDKKTLINNKETYDRIFIKRKDVSNQ